MRLALITPKGVYFSNDPELSLFFESFETVTAENLLMPRHEYWSGGGLGLLVVAALTPPEFDIHFIDENYESIDFDERYDIVGISAMTQQATRAYEIADQFRKRGATVVLGGIHATVMPEEAKQHADAVVIGEAEHTWPRLIDDYVTQQIKPFYKSTIPVDMTQSPMPRYDLLKKYNYNMIWLQTSRGCPRDCEFCAASNVYGRAYRHKTTSQVLKEVNYIKSLWKEPVIDFADDNMFADKVYSNELVRKLGSAGLRWTAQADMSVADSDTFLELLRKNGCILLFIGFETLSKKGRIDKHGWKQHKIDRYPEIIRKIQSSGIVVFGAFIVGLDEDDNSVFEDLSTFIINNHIYASQITVPTPLPGTRLREKLVRESRILSNNWQRYTFRDVNFIPKKMKADELCKGVLEVYKKIYSKQVRLSVIRHFKDIYKKSSEQIYTRV